MGVRVYACMGVCVYACMRVWVYACMGVCVYGCMRVQVNACTGEFSPQMAFLHFLTGQNWQESCLCAYQRPLNIRQAALHSSSLHVPHTQRERERERERVSAVVDNTIPVLSGVYARYNVPTYEAYWTYTFPLK